jgi:hypothetical protein
MSVFGREKERERVMLILSTFKKSSIPVIINTTEGCFENLRLSKGRKISAVLESLRPAGKMLISGLLEDIPC